MTAQDGVNGTVCNAQQYQQSLQSYDRSSPWISCLTHGDSIGLAFAAEASFLSCICIVIIFIWIGWNVRWYKKTFPNGKWKLFQRPADIYMVSLFVFDLLQAMGGILNVRWAHNGIVMRGPYCTAQGIIQQTGELGVALITLLLAVHTFVVAVLQVGHKARGVAFSLVSLAWIFVTLWVAIGAGTNKNYETPTPYWCWISPHFSRERIGGETVWMWTALFASAILYIPLYFWAEGCWSVDERYKFHWRSPDERVGYTQRRATLGLLLYPVGYCLVILPITTARCLEWAHYDVPSTVIFFNVSIFNLSGVINVVLFLIARPRLLLFPRPKELDGQKSQLTQASTSTGSAIFSNAAIFQHSSVLTSATLVNGGSRDSATPSFKMGSTAAYTHCS